MPSPQPFSTESKRRRLSDLLADRATGETLDLEAERELARLLELQPDVDPESFELAAAAVPLALLAASVEALPVRLRQRLLWLAHSLAQRGARGARAPKALANPWLGWLAAAAASLLLVLQVFGPSNRPSPAEVRGASDALVVAWAETGDPGGAGVRGEVTWSDELGTGFLSFVGLPANDPSENQYQLWIFDAERPADYPVDGGVFDSNGNELSVAINAKLDVDRPTLFAVTLERPGGVVVSTRERLLLTATPAP
ncbi:MAG: anti-sigma factor [Planctomycetes bacterium]|nr:anti-sigma factor [Planctomycetota bacterium]